MIVACYHPLPLPACMLNFDLVSMPFGAPIPTSFSENVFTLVNPWRACAARVTVLGHVCVCVCVSVKSHLTSGASVRPENTVAYSAGNGGQKICGVSFKPLRSRVMA